MTSLERRVIPIRQAAAATSLLRDIRFPMSRPANIAEPAITAWAVPPGFIGGSRERGRPIFSSAGAGGEMQPDPPVKRRAPPRALRRRAGKDKRIRDTA